MKKLVFLLICAISAVLVFNSCSGDQYKKYQKIAEKNSQKIGVPKQLVPYLRIDSIKAVSANELKYYYTLLQELPFTSDEFVEIQHPAIIDIAKRQMKMEQLKSEYAEYIKDNITLTYQYNKLDGSVFAEISIYPSDYK